MPLQKLPTVDLDNVNHRRRARETINQVLDHSFDDSRRQTAAEKLAGVTPINPAFPPLDLRRYGASEEYDATVNDLPYWNTALDVIDATTNKTGTITGAARQYRIDGTLEISVAAGIDFGPSNNGTPGNGFSLFSETNAPILVFSAPSVSRFMSWANFSVCGTSVKAATGSAKTSQHGIVIDNGGVHMFNVSIRACGGTGFLGCFSNGATYQNINAVLCDGDAIQIDTTQSNEVGAFWGHNTWINCTGNTNAGDGFHPVTADGRDKLFSCDFEFNDGIGRHYESGIIGFREWGGHSEVNTGGSVVFESGSNHNVIETIWGDSGGVDLDPVNNGGVGNRVEGQKFASGGGGFNTERIGPKLIDYKETSYSAYSTQTPNAIPLDNTLPQASGEGVTVMTVSYTPKHAGTVIKIFGHAWVSISAGAYAIASGFNSGHHASNAAAVGIQATAVDTLVCVPISFPEFVTTSTTSLSINVNIGSNAAATVRFNGISGDLFSTAVKSFLRVEEYWRNP